MSENGIALNRPRQRASILLLCLVSYAGFGAEPPKADHPYESLPYTPSLDVSAMDRSVDPCDNLYAYACGGWQKKHPIPADQANWSTYAKLYDDNQHYLWGVLQHAAEPRAERSSTEQKIGDYFAACMDTSAIDAKGIVPLRSDLVRIDALPTKREIAALLAELHLRTEGSGLMFGVGSGQDAKDANQVIGIIYSGGLGLPDRDYYLKPDPKSKEIRTHYAAHIQQLFQLLGESAADAKTHAAVVMRIETALARATLTRVDKRDPYKTYHRTSLSQLQTMMPAFDWSGYVRGAHVETRAWLDVSEPRFMRELNRQIEGSSLNDLKTYLRWGLVNAQARYLSAAFVDADFSFRLAYLLGVQEQKPRWKKCVALVDRDLGEALGKTFVERTFPSSVKAQAMHMTEQIRAAMRQRIEQLDWMTPATKVQALAKLDAIKNKIGYPEVWRDYSRLDIERGDFYGNLSRATFFESERQFAKIGKPVDRSEWAMSPPTVNAYYDPQLNDINFPAAVLLPPLFDPKLDDAPNYGNTGGTIGHELTHAFDDEGRKYDQAGNLRDWWTAEDGKEFESRAQCVRDQYSQYVVVDDIKVNGALTSGEDIADLGGLILAWIAWQEQTKSMQLESRDGLTPEQRFFVGFAQWDCANERPEYLRANAIVNPHSPPSQRINGVLVNMPEFAQAFSCKANQPLLKPKKDICRVW